MKRSEYYKTMTVVAILSLVISTASYSKEKPILIMLPDGIQLPVSVAGFGFWFDFIVLAGMLYIIYKWMDQPKKKRKRR